MNSCISAEEWRSRRLTQMILTIVTVILEPSHHVTTMISKCWMTFWKSLSMNMFAISSTHGGDLCHHNFFQTTMSVEEDNPQI